MQFRKPPSEAEAREWLLDNRLALAPLRFRLEKTEPRYSPETYWDFELEAWWGDKAVGLFAAEYKTLSTPKAFDEALQKCVAAKLPKPLRPLILMPYLREDQLSRLENLGFSGIDWCGNGVVMMDRFRVFRTGGSNRFTTYAPIKNVYRKNTSMVGRALLCIGQVDTVGQLLEEVNGRNILAQALGQVPMSLGTVSKALASLESDLIVERTPRIRLLQADKLLNRLQQNYEPPTTEPIRLKVDCGFEQLPRHLMAMIDRTVGPVMATGLSSVRQYATMQREEVLSLYCPRTKEVKQAIKGRETDRFFNVELIESFDQPVYFDANADADGFSWASPVQTYLELMRGDKRDRETADQVNRYILSRTRTDV